MLAPPGMDLCELPRISFNTTLTTSISSRYFNIFQTFNKMMQLYHMYFKFVIFFFLPWLTITVIICRYYLTGKINSPTAKFRVFLKHK